MIFAKIAVDIVGAEALTQMALDFGFGDPYDDFSLPVSGSSVTASRRTSGPREPWPRRPSARARYSPTPSRWRSWPRPSPTTAGWWSPASCSEVRSPDGIILDKPTASIRSRRSRPDTARTLNEMMQQVIIQGGLTEAEIPGVKVAGKTGTAESGNGEAHSWWITFAPADDPEIAMCVMVENGGRADEGALPDSGTPDAGLPRGGGLNVASTRVYNAWFVQQLVDNRYRLLKPLGSGGMADVFLAHDDILDRDVALKVMSTRYASDEEFVERFKREAQSAAALSHPNIVSIFDRGESEDGTYYIAMEYLPGGTLKDRILKRGALPAHTAAAVALQMAEALRAAHERDVIHRDIKPHNILVTGSGDVKVTDFGIARAASSSTMTRTGHILGTAHYISPEQAMGEHVGPASDLYSLGVVLYEMLTGELPFDADTPIGIAMKHVNGHVRPPQELNPSVPDGINAITLRLLAKNPEDRYGSDAELIDDLERFCAGLDPSGATTEMMTRAMPAATARMGPPPPPQGADRDKKRRGGGPCPCCSPSSGSCSWPRSPGPATACSRTGSPARTRRRIGVPSLVGMNLDEAEDEVGDDFDIQVSDSVDGEKPVDTITEPEPQHRKGREGIGYLGHRRRDAGGRRARRRRLGARGGRAEAEGCRLRGRGGRAGRAPSRTKERSSARTPGVVRAPRWGPR